MRRPAGRRSGSAAGASSRRTRASDTTAVRMVVAQCPWSVAGGQQRDASGSAYGLRTGPRPPSPLAQFEPPVGGRAGEHFGPAVGPGDLDGIDALRRAEPDVDARVVAARKTAGGVGRAHPAAL